MKRAALVVLAACGGKATPAEVDDDPIACEGDRTIANEDDLDALGKCESIDGDVTIRGAVELDLAVLASLEVVGGQLMVGPTFALDTIRLDVRDVGSLRIVSNGVAGGVHLPRLERAGEVEIAANLGVAQVVMPALEDVKGDLIIEQNPALTLVDLGTLETVGGILQLRHDAVLTIVEIGALQHAGGVDLTGSGIPEDHPLRNFTPKPD